MSRRQEEASAGLWGTTQGDSTSRRTGSWASLTFMSPPCSPHAAGGLPAAEMATDMMRSGEGESGGMV